MRRAYLLMIILPVVTIILGLLVGCVSETTTSTQFVKDVTAQEAMTIINENQDNPEFIIADVRTLAEFNDGHIENAVNIDFNSEAFRSEIGKLDRNNKYLVYCRSGNRSSGAVKLMLELEFTDVYHLYEGIIGWTSGGYSTVK